MSGPCIEVPFELILRDWSNITLARVIRLRAHLDSIPIAEPGEWVEIGRLAAYRITGLARSDRAFLALKTLAKDAGISGLKVKVDGSAWTARVNWPSMNCWE